MFTEWLANPSPYLLILVPALAFLEAAAGIGIFVSGIFLLSTSTVLYSSGVAEIQGIVALAFMGALAGDTSAYVVGRLFGDRVWQAPVIRRYEGRRERILKLLRTSTPVAIIAGRLTPAIRSITPIAVGMTGLSFRHFLVMDILACAIDA